MKPITTSFMVLAGGLISFSMGCEKKEKVIDIKAPGVEIEVNKTKDGIEVETERRRGSGVEIDVNKQGGSDVNVDIKKR
jgi:hypothetical protein